MINTNNTYKYMNKMKRTNSYGNDLIFWFIHEKDWIYFSGFVPKFKSDDSFPWKRNKWNIAECRVSLSIEVNTGLID